MAIAISRAAQLKPEIQLVQAVSEFEAALNSDQKARFHTYRKEEPPNAIDVMRLTAEIDRDESKTRQTRQCVGPRLTSILQSVQQFSTTIDIVIGGGQNLIASAVWGVIKMSLLVLESISMFRTTADKVFLGSFRVHIIFR